MIMCCPIDPGWSQPHKHGMCGLNDFARSKFDCIAPPESPVFMHDKMDSATRDACFSALRAFLHDLS